MSSSTNSISLPSLAGPIVSNSDSSATVSTAPSLSNFSSSSIVSLSGSSSHPQQYDEDGLIRLESVDDLATMPLLPDSPAPSTTAALASAIALASASSSSSSLPPLALPAASSTVSSSVSSLSITSSTAPALYSALSLNIPGSPTSVVSPKAPKEGSKNSSSSSAMAPVLTPEQKAHKKGQLSRDFEKLVGLGGLHSPTTDLSQTMFSPRGAAFRKIQEGIAEAGDNPTDEQLQGIEDRRNITRGKLREVVNAISEFNRRLGPGNRDALIEEISTRLGVTAKQFEDLMVPAN